MGMAGREAEIGVRLGRDSCYQAMFARAPFLKMAAASTLPTWRALASFERTLVSQALGKSLCLFATDAAVEET
jgi:cytochrome c peroxidase